jgi:hypothetical protein
LNISDWIRSLASPERGEREGAALGIYRYGKSMGEAAISRWRVNADFAAQLTGAATVGVAVSPAHFEMVRAAMGHPPLADVPADQDAREFEVHIGAASGEAWLDILTTRAPGAGGAMDRFLSKFGEGIQQVEFPVRKVDAASACLREEFGVQPVYAEARPGANGTRVNFFLAATPDGKKVLIELVEAA